MPTEIADSKNYNLISGEAYFQEAGATGMDNFGNLTLHKLDPNRETKSHYRSVRGVLKLDREDVTKIEPKFTITGDEYTDEVLAIIMFGEKGSPVTQAAITTAATVTFNDVIPGKTYSVGKTKLTDVSVTVSSSTKAAGTDYELDAELGFIRILKNGSIVEGDDVVVSHKCTAHTRTSLSAFTKPKRTGTLYLFQFDAVSPEPLRKFIIPCDISAESIGEFSMEDFAKWSITAAVKGNMTIETRQ